jgi:uncharacterized protein (UPF0276 family)
VATSLSTVSCRGAGLGLRPAHLYNVCRDEPAVPWFEVHICNFLGGGLNRALLRRISERYSLSFHGVNLNLGGVDTLDTGYLQKLKGAIDELQPALISEHACFNTHQQHYFHDLMPIPYTEEAVANMAARIRQVQDYLGRRILIENISRYYCYTESQLSEGEFLSAVCEEADCGLLLDLNNAYVNQCNLGEDLNDFVSALPLSRVGEIHLAGYCEQDGLLIDTHSTAPCSAVWDHYRDFCELCPDIPCLIEWDSDLPSLPELIEQQLKAQRIIDKVRKAGEPIRHTG